jgi:dienelactone hydrolase
MRGAVAICLLAGVNAYAGLVENVTCTKDKTQSYTLYLPSKYTTDRKWPALFVFDPRSRGTFAAELFRNGAEEHGWILLSSNNTRSDTGWDVNVRALEAMVPELSKYAVDPQRIYAAGFSGGATVAWVLARAQNLAGVITAGQPYQPDIDPAHMTFAVWGSAGIFDFNNQDVRHIDIDAARSGRPHHVEIFDGVHQWTPEPLARAAIEWHEIQAMRLKLRPVDASIVDRAYQAEVHRAESAPTELAALRRYEGIVRDFEGVHDTSDAARKVAAVRDSARIRDQLRDEKKADDWERSQIVSMVQRLRDVLAEDVNPLSAVRRLGVARLQRETAEPTAHAAAARRVLESLAAQAGFYLPEKYFAARDYNRAAVVLSIATIVKPERAGLHYDLARAQARAGRKEEALTALERSLALGVKNVDPRSEEDFSSLRALPRFEEILRGSGR